MILKKSDEFINQFKLLISNADEINITSAYFSNKVFEIFYDEFLHFYNNGKKFNLIIGIDTKEDEINLLKHIEKGTEADLNEYVINEFFGCFQELRPETLYLIHNLFLSEKMEIRIGYIEGGIYHSKYYIFKTENKYSVINGSLNLTTSGLFRNFEVVDLYTDTDKGIEYSELFTEVWNNISGHAKCIKLSEYITKFVEDVCVSKGYEIVKELDTNIKIREYQQEAINMLLLNDFNGFFKMATGTGKTFTALNAVYHFSKQKNKNIVTHIVVPYLHLAAQWNESIKNMYGNDVFILECHSKTSWKAEFDYVEYEVLRKPVFLIFVDNTYFKNLDFISNYMKKISLLIVDEAHNLTIPQLTQLHKSNMYLHKLGLSATPKHYLENERTNLLFSYFKGEVFEYDLKSAIDNNFLTKYNYIPILINLSEDEAKTYRDINIELKDKDNKQMILNLLNDQNKLLSRATGKMEKLQELVTYRKINNSLFYCYPGKVKNSDYSYIEYTGDIIHEVQPRLRLEKITANESIDKRMQIATNLKNKRTDGILAIKCLDEGFDIPAVSDAYILSSTRNPNEFVQRRGRVLRKFEGKDITNIYDFIVAIDEEILATEIDRFEEYASLAENQKQINSFRRLNKWESTDE